MTAKVQVRVRKFFGTREGFNTYIRNTLVPKIHTKFEEATSPTATHTQVRNFKNMLVPHIERLQAEYQKYVNAHKSGNPNATNAFLKALQLGQELGLLQTYYNYNLTNNQVRRIADGRLRAQLGRNLNANVNRTLTRFRSSAYSGRGSP
jgi:hypothetical protein